MKKEIFQKIEIPESVEATIDKNTIIIRGSEGENKRTFDTSNLDFKKEGNTIIIGNKKSTKKEKKRINSISAHIKNMMEGVQKKFEYKLKICFSHFPFTVEIKGKEVFIKNFLGEKIARKMKLPEGVDVDNDKEIITIHASDKEIAGRVAADFERATKIKKRDRRVFQDGIYMISKSGREI
jgi:large subunit ribosomal protein L6